MAFASVTYTSASGTTFALTNSSGDPIPYLRQADISVTVNGVLQVQGTDYTFNTAGTSIILSSSVSGATVIISRTTDISDATVVYTAGSTLTAQDLNNADNQIRYGLQEFSDTYDALTTGTGDLETLGGFIGSNEAWVSDNSHAATTGAIDNRVDGKIDTALTTDVVAGDSITVTDNTPSSGQITIGVTNASITTAKLVDSSVTTAKIADSNVTTVKIADGNVTTAKILDANVTTAKIADSAVTSAKIADGTIVAADLASDSVTTAKILDGNVTTAKILDGNITTAKLADSSVTSAKIADGTIVAGDLANDAVTTAKILDANVTTAKIADSNVTTAKIADSAVTAVKIADGVITSAKLNASTVVTNAEQSGSTPDDTSFFTTSASDSRYVNATGDTMSGALAMGSNKITGLDTPTATADAATKGYVDGLVAAATLADADYGDITVSGSATVWTIDNGAVTSAKIADDTIVNADINSAAAIAHSKLASITAGSVLLGDASNVPTATALSGDVTVDSSGVTAIGSGVVVDADISASAAIAGTKISPDFGSQNVVTTGDLTVDTNTLYVDSTNNRVGIGTTSPSAAMHVAAANNSQVFIAATDANPTTIIIDTDAGSSERVRINNKDGALTFDTSNSLERARIDSSGRLLVGTSSASANAFLQVQANAGGSTGAGWIDVQRGSTGLTNNNQMGLLSFSDSAGNFSAWIECYADADHGSGDYPGRLVFSTTADGASSPTERLRIGSNGFLSISGTSSNPAAENATNASAIGNGAIRTSCTNVGLQVNRRGSDGTLVEFRQDATTEGTISVSGTTVTYGGGHLARWSQLPNEEDPSNILKGTVLSNLDEMCEWGEEDNEQLNKTKVSDVEGDPNVAGVFVSTSFDEDGPLDFFVAMTGDMIIRIAEGVTVQRGDLLMSAGDGTAKPQDDDIIRSKTIAKVTSTHVTCTYDDGSYCVPCVLMAC